MIEAMNQNLVAPEMPPPDSDAHAVAQAEYKRVYAASFALIVSLEGEAE